jgi:hypothetical protein
MRQHQIDLLFCFLIALVVGKPQKRSLIMPLLLMSIYSYLDANIFGWSMVYILPTIMLADYFDQHLHVKWIIPYLMLTAGIGMKFALNFIMHGIAISSIHATEIVTYNMIALVICTIIQNWLENKFSSHK